MILSHYTELIKMKVDINKKCNVMQNDLIDMTYSNMLRIAVEYDLGNISDEVYNMLQQKEFVLLTDWIKND